VFRGRLPGDVRAAVGDFEALWAMHPAEPHEVTMFGRCVATPRYQQAFGHDYVYSGNVNRASPVPGSLVALVRWLQVAIDPALNGLLVNWYDGTRRHYMGPHRDTTAQLDPDHPIVTVSFGEERVFRLRRWGTAGRGARRHDLLCGDGDLVVLPWATNAAYTHAVPRLARYRGRRISGTARAFALGRTLG